MRDLRFQLVFQFAASAPADESDLLRLMDALEADLAGQSDTEVDGFDFGMGEFNIFIHTDRPHEIFPIAADRISNDRPDLPFSAGFRAFTNDEYTNLWPEGSSFSVA